MLSHMLLHNFKSSFVWYTRSHANCTLQLSKKYFKQFKTNSLIDLLNPEELKLLPEKPLNLVTVVMAEIDDLNYLDLLILFYHLGKLEKTVIEVICMNWLQSYLIVLFLEVLVELEPSLLLEVQGLCYDVCVLVLHLLLKCVPFSPVYALDFLPQFFWELALKPDVVISVE